MQEISDLMKNGNTPEQKLLLVHGSVIPTSGPDQGRRINHAWIEVGILACEVSNKQQIEEPQERYYKAFTAKVYKKYTDPEANLEVLKSEHYGPWDELSLNRENECLKATQ